MILGTLNFDYKYTSSPVNPRSFLTTCLDNGVNVIDTAYYYNRAEEFLGKCPEISQVSRELESKPMER